MTTERKMCRLCSPDGDIDGWWGACWATGSDVYKIACNNCGTMAQSVSADGATARWNRLMDTPVPAPIALPGEETLHDKYTMAALTGLLAYSCNDGPSGNYHSNCTVDGAISAARDYADAAMKARGT